MRLEVLLTRPEGIENHSEDFENLPKSIEDGPADPGYCPASKTPRTRSTHEALATRSDTDLGRRTGRTTPQMSKIEAWIAGDRLTAALVAHPASGRSVDRVSVDCSASRQDEATVSVLQIVQGDDGKAQPPVTPGSRPTRLPSQLAFRSSAPARPLACKIAKLPRTNASSLRSIALSPDTIASSLRDICKSPCYQHPRWRFPTTGVVESLGISLIKTARADAYQRWGPRRRPSSLRRRQDSLTPLRVASETHEMAISTSKNRVGSPRERGVAATHRESSGETAYLFPSHPPQREERKGEEEGGRGRRGGEDGAVRAKVAT
ncbi:uncharacterized protein SCHCODRAFT_02685026 [Schizophyllum commune H4-8]|uniref:uncharacterized protein n=1 Tax=Schizophyllum commune (strain H4-8 / FGSC 9210) TaxID=578458 RepID=UPI00215F0B53|nr:uncharacterized protein SCHCODRAFT_02685026 [Schizophyllum commune H4-8]KAI5898893.1 hypothetical protein SCHCODRAFT_02685026 [Schizophyllum commune H4-8]